LTVRSAKAAEAVAIDDDGDGVGVKYSDENIAYKEEKGASPWWAPKQARAVLIVDR
jgi:hypothetical protein